MLSIALEWLMLCSLWHVIHCSGYVGGALCTIHFNRTEKLRVSQDQVVLWIFLYSCNAYCHLAEIFYFDICCQSEKGCFCCC